MTDTSRRKFLQLGLAASGATVLGLGGCGDDTPPKKSAGDGGEKKGKSGILPQGVDLDKWNKIKGEPYALGEVHAPGVCVLPGPLKKKIWPDRDKYKDVEKVEGDEEEVLEELAQDYCQLFLGPKGHLPPYQSVWTSGQFQDQTSTSVRQYLGLIADAKAWAGETMLDHLGIQLEAMGALTAEFAARQDGSPEQLASLADLAGAFFRDHLTWPRRLFALASTRATTEFYQRVIEVTRRFLELEADRLSIRTDS